MGTCNTSEHLKEESRKEQEMFVRMLRVKIMNGSKIEAVEYLRKQQIDLQVKQQQQSKPIMKTFKEKLLKEKCVIIESVAHERNKVC